MRKIIIAMLAASTMTLAGCAEQKKEINCYDEKYIVGYIVHSIHNESIYGRDYYKIHPILDDYFKRGEETKKAKMIAEIRADIKNPTPTRITDICPRGAENACSYLRRSTNDVYFMRTINKNDNLSSDKDRIQAKFMQQCQTRGLWRNYN